MFVEAFYWSYASNGWWLVSLYFLYPESGSAAPLTRHRGHVSTINNMDLWASGQPFTIHFTDNDDSE